MKLTYRDAVHFVLEDRRAADFSIEQYLYKLTH